MSNVERLWNPTLDKNISNFNGLCESLILIPQVEDGSDVLHMLTSSQWTLMFLVPVYEPLLEY
jgi:hypothetical protein